MRKTMLGLVLAALMTAGLGSAAWAEPAPAVQYPASAVEAVAAGSDYTYEELLACLTGAGHPLLPRPGSLSPLRIRIKKGAAAGSFFCGHLFRESPGAQTAPGRFPPFTWFSNSIQADTICVRLAAGRGASPEAYRAA